MINQVARLKKSLAQMGVLYENCFIKAYKFKTINKMFTFLSVLHNNGIQETGTVNYGTNGERKLVLVYLKVPDKRIDDIAKLYDGVSFKPR